MKVIVWSKERCIYCSEAKALLKLKGIEFEERNIEKGEWTREQFTESNPTAKTFPQIWFDDKLIGGFTELKKELK